MKTVRIRNSFSHFINKIRFALVNETQIFINIIQTLSMALFSQRVSIYSLAVKYVNRGNQKSPSETNAQIS